MIEKLNDIQLTEYLKSLDLDNPEHKETYNTINKLLLLSNSVFMRAITYLYNDKVTIDDFMALPDLREPTVLAYLDTVDNDGLVSATYRNEAKEAIENSANYKEFLNKYLGQDYGYDPELATSYNERIKIEAMIAKLQSNSALSSYANIDGFSNANGVFKDYPSLQRRYQEIILEDNLLKEYLHTIETHPLHVIFPKLTDTVLTCNQKVEWLVRTNKIKPLFPNKPILRELLSRIYRYGNHSIWINYIERVCKQAGLAAAKDTSITSLDALWKEVNLTGGILPFNLLDGETDFFERFLLMQIMYYYIPKLTCFDSYRTETYYESKLKEIEDIREYLDILSTYLRRIVTVCNKKLKPERTTKQA